MGDNLNAAIARLADFRASWDRGDLICESSKLTADDLDQALDAMREKASGAYTGLMRVRDRGSADG